MFSTPINASMIFEQNYEQVRAKISFIRENSYFMIHEPHKRKTYDLTKIFLNPYQLISLQKQLDLVK